jgi:hypothetical protein
MKIFLLGTIIGVGWLLVDHRIDKAHAEGFKVGMNYALKSNPPSEELEMVCAGLWVGEQNKRQYQKGLK